MFCVPPDIVSIRPIVRIISRYLYRYTKIVVSRSITGGELLVFNRLILGNFSKVEFTLVERYPFCTRIAFKISTSGIPRDFPCFWWSIGICYFFSSSDIEVRLRIGRPHSYSLRNTKLLNGSMEWTYRFLTALSFSIRSNFVRIRKIGVLARKRYP